MPIFLKKLLFAFKESINPHPEIYPLKNFSFEDINLENAVADFLNNHEKMNKIAIENSAKYFKFLQPFNHVGSRQYTSFCIASNSHNRRFKTKDGASQTDIIFDFFSKLYSKIKNYKNIIDLQNIFEQTEGEIYLDHVHFSDKGNYLIAKAISEKILENENG